jgi:peroxiredoxin
VYAHPGHFYDFAQDGYLVVSLITPERQFAEGMERLLAAFWDKALRQRSKRTAESTETLRRCSEGRGKMLSSDFSSLQRRELMKGSIRAMLCALVLVLAAGQFSARAQEDKIAKTPLKTGDTAPDFTLLSNEWKPVTLSEFRGKKNVILAFYVLAFTGGWTKELQAYQADLAKLEKNDTVVLGISIDSPAANAAFAKQINVTFPLLSDMNKKVLMAYGIMKPYDVKGDSDKYMWAERTTIVVDKEGKIQHVEQGNSAVDPNSAVSVCTNLHEKHGQ